MTVSIKKPVTKDKINQALEQIEKQGTGLKPTLKSCFGSLVRGIDPLAYQNQIRDEWN